MLTIQKSVRPILLQALWQFWKKTLTLQEVRFWLPCYECVVLKGLFFLLLMFEIQKVLNSPKWIPRRQPKC